MPRAAKKILASTSPPATVVQMPDPVASPWPEVDLAWLGPPTAAGPDFPIEFLPPAVRDMVAAFAEQRRLPVDFVAAAVLGAASAAIGNRARLVTYDGRSEALALFIAIIGWPGSGKTSALDIAEAPLMRIEEALVEAYRAQLSGRTRLSRLAEQLRPTVSRRLVFEGIDIDNIAEVGEDAPPPALLLSEWTAAGLIEELRHGRDGRTIFADELTGALAGASGQNGLKARALILQGFDGKPYKKRTATGGMVVVPALQITILGATQPDRVAALVGRARDGLTPRFLWIAPEIKPTSELAQGSGPAQELEEALSKLVQISPAADETGYPHLVPLAQDARAPLEAAARDWVDAQLRADTASQDVIARARQQAIRIASVLAQVEHALSGQDGPIDEVTAVDVERGIALMNRYFLPMAERAFAIAGAPRESGAMRVARFLRRLGKPAVNLREDLYRGAGSPVRTPADVADALEELRQRGFVRDAARRVGPGRPSVTIEVHPALLAP